MRQNTGRAVCVVTWVAKVVGLQLTTGISDTDEIQEH